jgi:pyruvate formate lyase activating enzyme
VSDLAPGAVPTLEAKSPYELRVHLGEDVPDSDVRTALQNGQRGFLHSYTTASAVDGPGMRVVAWTTGCQFKCLYCHNPDTWKMSNGIPETLARAAGELAKYRTGLQVMSGGLTISGGEPLLQDRFVVDLATAARNLGIHTALDTNGFLGERLSDADLEAFDLVLLDLKTWDDDRHRTLTGQPVGPVHDFARRLAAKKRPVWVRFVLVPGLTDDAANIEPIATFCQQLGNVERVDVLPFHQLGRFKWQQLRMEYALEETEPPKPEIVEKAVAIFRALGLKAY